MKTHCLSGSKIPVTYAPGIQVVVAEGPSQQSIPADLPSLERKRQTNWHHAARNQLIAKTAAGFANKNLEALWAIGLFLDEPSWPESIKCNWIALLVESIEHARSLSDILPAFEMWCAEPRSGGPPQGLPFWSERRTIVTTTAASLLHQFRPNIVINAMANDPILVVPNIGPPNDRDDVLVVEIADDFDARAEADTNRRLAAYGANNWRIDAPERWLRWMRRPQ